LTQVKETRRPIRFSRWTAGGRRGDMKVFLTSIKNADAGGLAGRETGFVSGYGLEEEARKAT